MDQTVDALLLNNIVDSLRSSDVDSISSTCSFLETVVIYDFPAESFLQQRELFVVSFLMMLIVLESLNVSSLNINDLP